MVITYLSGERIQGSSTASDHAQSTADTGRTSSSTRTRASQKIDSSHAIAGMAISNVTFTMEKTGSFGSGTCYARIYNTSNVLVGTIGSVDGATLTTYSTDPPTTDVKFSGTTVTMPSGGGYLSVDLPAEITFAEWNSTESNGYLSLYQSGSWVNFTSEALKYVVNLTDEKTTISNVPVGTRFEETDTRKIFRSYETDVTGEDLSLTGLNAYFKFDEASGDLINQASNVGSTDQISGNGTNANVTYSETGKIGSAYSYNGTSSKIEIDTLIPTAATGSVFWWWNASTFVDVPWGWGDTNADTFIFCEVESNTVSVYARNAGTNKFYVHGATVSNPTGTWHSCCITHDGTAPLMYLDGVEGTSFTNSDDKTFWLPDASGMDNFSVCFERRNNLSLNYWHGLIDELSVWSRALTAAEILTLHNSGSGKAINTNIWKEKGTA